MPKNSQVGFWFEDRQDTKHLMIGVKMGELECPFKLQLRLVRPLLHRQTSNSTYNIPPVHCCLYGKYFSEI